MRLAASLLVACLLVGCTSSPGPSAGADADGGPDGDSPDRPTSPTRTPAPPVAPPPPPIEPAQESWHGIIAESGGPSVELLLDMAPGPDNAMRSLVQLPDPQGSDFLFTAHDPSRGWPAGTPLHGGVSLEFHAPLLEDLVVSVTADGEVVASRTFPAPMAYTPTDGPILYGLPDRLDGAVAAGARLGLVAHVAATADVVLHASQEHPSGLTLGP